MENTTTKRIKTVQKPIAICGIKRKLATASIPQTTLDTTTERTKIQPKVYLPLRTIAGSMKTTANQILQTNSTPELSVAPKKNETADILNEIDYSNEDYQFANVSFIQPNFL